VQGSLLCSKVCYFHLKLLMIHCQDYCLLSVCHDWRPDKYCNLLLIKFSTAFCPIYHKGGLVNFAMLWEFQMRLNFPCIVVVSDNKIYSVYIRTLFCWTTRQNCLFQPLSSFSELFTKHGNA
jgi:hypothetical protein